jgi:hypothetical protein
MATHLLAPFRFATMLGHEAVCFGHSSTELCSLSDDIDSVYHELNASQLTSFFDGLPSVDVDQGEGNTATYMLQDDFEQFVQQSHGLPPPVVVEEQLSAREIFDMYSSDDVGYCSSKDVPMSLLALEPLKVVENVEPMIDPEKKALYNETWSASIDDLTPLRQNGRKRNSFCLTSVDGERPQKKKDKVPDMKTDFLADIIKDNVIPDAPCEPSSFDPVSAHVRQLRENEHTETHMDLAKFLKLFHQYKKSMAFWDFMKKYHIQECTNQMINNKVTRAIVWKA